MSEMKKYIFRNFIVAFIFVFSGMLLYLGGDYLPSLFLWVLPMMFYTRNRKGEILLEEKSVIRVTLTVILLVTSIVILPNSKLG
jgi:hypothetical protein